MSEKKGFFISNIFNMMFIVIGLFVAYMSATEYVVWTENMPGGGFFPMVSGISLAICGLLMILDKKNAVPINLTRNSLVPIAAIILTLISNLLIGLLPSVTLMVFLWLIIIEKYTWKKSLFTAVIVGAVTFGIFGMWLKVPFPEGLLGRLI